MTLSALYSETILEHNRAPRNFGRLPSATHSGEGRNASCGDSVRMAIEVSENGSIIACCFEGEGCAICTASASLLSMAVLGKNAEAVSQLGNMLQICMQNGTGDAAILGAMQVFSELQAHPARRACALLPFDAMLAALKSPLLPNNKKQQVIQYRSATEEDIPAIVALVESAYRGDSSRQGWTTEADFLDGQRTDAASVAALIQIPDSQVLLAFIDNDLWGCAHLEGHDGMGYFGMFAVSPKVQGGGIGAALLAEAERNARVIYGCAVMTMTVISIRKELIAFYTRRGYQATGTTKPFPYGDEHFGLPKRADLEFIVLAKPLV